MKNFLAKRGPRAFGFSSLLLAASLATTQLTGCFTVGQEFSPVRVPEIKVGQTRKQDITEMFGTPWRTGMEDGIAFWGGSCVIGPDGKPVVVAPKFDESLTIAEIDTDAIRRARWRLPLLRDEQGELVRHELGRIAKRELGG